MFLRIPERPKMPVNKVAAIVSVLCVFFFAVVYGQDNNSRYYNVKAGPVLFTLSGAVSTEYVDNVNLSSGLVTPIQSDIIVSPSLNLNAITEVEMGGRSQTETLSLNMNVGYTEYMMHSELNQNPLNITISPGSELAFVVHSGHFVTRFHDSITMQENPASDGTLSNVAQFSRLTNTVGFNTQWNVNSRSSLSLGYDHSNLVPLSFVSLSGTSPQNLNVFSNSSDQVSLSAVSKVLPVLSLGARASAQTTSFPDNPAQDSTSYSYGPFAELRISDYTSLNASCGVSEVRSNSNASSGINFASSGANNSTNYDYELSLVNRMNRYYSQTLSFGRQNSLDILGQQTLADSIRYSSTWKINSVFTLDSSIFAEDDTTLGGIYYTPHYRRYGCTFGTSYRITKKLVSSIFYQYVDKVSDDPVQSYKQNSVILNFSYAF